MTTPIVTLARAQVHLRTDDDYESDNIQLYLDAAIDYAQQYTNRIFYANTDDLAAGVLAETAGDDPIVAPPSVIAAILLTVGRLYENRSDMSVGSRVTLVALPEGAKSLLLPYRVGMGV